jgi:hypothetical protein
VSNGRQAQPSAVVNLLTETPPPQPQPYLHNLQPFKRCVNRWRSVGYLPGNHLYFGRSARSHH